MTADRVFGRYRLLERLGAGGMAEVYRAVMAGPHGFEKDVALKRIHPHLTLDHPEVAERLVREARLVARLRHRHIVPVVDFGEVDGVYYLAMELVDGWTLSQLLRTRGQEGLPPSVICDILSQVCHGLDYAHTLAFPETEAVGVVHRDVTPRNIMIDRTGHALILDFGIARVAGFAAVTGTGFTRGTPGYMSPEQIAGDDIDGRSDLFTLGAGLYEMVTGKPLFRAETVEGTLYRVLQSDLGPPVAQVEQAVPVFGRLMALLLSRERRQRPPSAVAVRRHLLAIRGSFEGPSLEEWVHGIAAEEDASSQVESTREFFQAAGRGGPAQLVPADPAAAPDPEESIVDPAGEDGGPAGMEDAGPEAAPAAEAWAGEETPPPAEISRETVLPAVAEPSPGDGAGAATPQAPGADEEAPSAGLPPVPPVSPQPAPFAPPVYYSSPDWEGAAPGPRGDEAPTALFAPLPLDAPPPIAVPLRPPPPSAPAAPPARPAPRIEVSGPRGLENPFVRGASLGGAVILAGALIWWIARHPRATDGPAVEAAAAPARGPISTYRPRMPEATAPSPYPTGDTAALYPGSVASVGVGPFVDPSTAGPGADPADGENATSPEAPGGRDRAAGAKDPEILPTFTVSHFPPESVRRGNSLVVDAEVRVDVPAGAAAVPPYELKIEYRPRGSSGPWSEAAMPPYASDGRFRGRVFMGPHFSTAVEYFLVLRSTDEEAPGVLAQAGNETRPYVVGIAARGPGG